MPTFSFNNKETGEVFDEWFNNNSQKEAFLSENPHIIQTITVAPALGDPFTYGLQKPASELTAKMNLIKKKYRGNNLQGSNLLEI